MTLKRSHNINELLLKYINNTISLEEAEFLLDYIKHNDVTEEFPSVEEVLDIISAKVELRLEDKDRIYRRLEEKIGKAEFTYKEKRPLFRNNTFLRLAAIFLFLVGLTVFFKLFDGTSKEEIISSSEITFIDGQGKIRVLDTTSTGVLIQNQNAVIVHQNKSQLVFSNKGKAHKLVYNTLNVPNGKRMQIVLSDGTVVHLNSGTSIRFPEMFIDGKKREVFISGEAFFDVAKDPNNMFVVHGNEIDVEVYGTQFNISNYPEEEVQHVVLVEGSVSMHQQKVPDGKVLLSPGMKGSLHKESELIETKEVVTDIYTSWMQGELVFRNASFRAILNSLERKYAVSFVLNNQTLAKERFNASFGNKPIEDVLQGLKNTYDISYTIEENIITIK
ncbi:FecR family protein [Zhouia amylolytica]|uniref:FecR family protein n=1 Tax=Zhouia amylolytica TaxID=376730 RepID=UPI0020CD6FB6|nr:FecR domain-containing protein [Zhouia amylolytica]MCQ0110068.1 DUF4974 domain-containing protein [Zhouia amylolytica]